MSDGVYSPVMSREFTPLPEVNERSERIKVDIESLGLPVGLDVERLGLNIAATERAAQYCDVSRLMIIGASMGEDEIDVSGVVNADSSVLSARAKMTAKAPFGQSITLGGGQFFKAIVGGAVLNKDYRKSSSQEIADLYSPEFQAQQLNAQLKKSLYQIAKESQVTEPSAGMWGKVLTASDGSLAAGIILDITSQEDSSSISFLNIGVRAAIQAMPLIDIATRNESRELKLSGFLGIRVDRFVRATGYLATRTLIAARQ